MGFIAALSLLSLTPVPAGVAKTQVRVKKSKTETTSPAASVSKEIIRKVEKLSSLRSRNNLPPVKRGDRCYLDQKHSAPNGEFKQACVVFVGQHRCLMSNFQKMKCGLPKKETECKVLKTGALLCDDPSKMVAVNTTCRYDRFGYSVCKIDGRLGLSEQELAHQRSKFKDRVPASIQKKTRPRN